jgi:hypothetical protein
MIAQFRGPIRSHKPHDCLPAAPARTVLLPLTRLGLTELCTKIRSVGTVSGKRLGYSGAIIAKLISQVRPRGHWQQFEHPSRTASDRWRCIDIHRVPQHGGRTHWCHLISVHDPGQCVPDQVQVDRPTPGLQAQFPERV